MQCQCFARAQQLNYRCRQYILSNHLLRKGNTLQLLHSLPPATKLEQGYIFTGFCDSVHRGGSASVHARIPHPLAADHPPMARQNPHGKVDPLVRQTPLARQTSLARQTPLARRSPMARRSPHGKADPPARQTPPLARRPLCAVHAGRYCQQMDVVHPTGMQFLLRRHSC